MACGSCKKRRSQKNASRVYQVMGGYKYLPDNQIKARLEVFKKRHCPDCENRYSCDFNRYNTCMVKPQ